MKLSKSTKTYRVTHGRKVWSIEAKWVPDAANGPEFRVSRVEGDINDPEGLKAAIIELLDDAPACRVTVAL